MDENEKKHFQRRMHQVETGHEGIGITIAEIQRQREEDRALMLRISDDLTAVKEIVTAWNNIKGFVETIKAINRTIWFIVKITAVIAALSTAIYLYGKTGHWTWPNDHTGQ